MIICSWLECPHRKYRMKLCRAHYKRSRTGEYMDAPIKRYMKAKGLTCRLSGCIHKAFALGLCASHSKNFYEARKRGTEDLGNWKKPIRKRRMDAKLCHVRVPNNQILRIQHYAELRGLSLEDALVEAAIRHLEERQKRVA